jgi:hypothetical protein
LSPPVFSQAAYELAPGSPSVPNWKGCGLDKFNLGLSDSLPRNQARNSGRLHILTPFLKPSWNPADSSLLSRLAGGRALDATRAARVDQNPRVVRAVAQTRKIRRRDVKLGCKGKHTQDRLGTPRELSLGAFSGSLSGNRRPMRRVPKWEAGPDLEKPGRFRSRLEVSHAPGSWPEPLASFCCLLPVKIPARLCKPRSIRMSMNANWNALRGGTIGTGRDRSGEGCPAPFRRGWL